MTFRKRNRFCKSKLQEVDVTSNEEFDLLQYLVNERRDEIIKSLPEKPNIRWWTRLEIKIEEGFNKGIIPDIALALLIITLTSRIPMSFNELNYLENIISIFLFSVLLTLCITVVIKSVYKDIFKLKINFFC